MSEDSLVSVLVENNRQHVFGRNSDHNDVLLVIGHFERVNDRELRDRNLGHDLIRGDLPHDETGFNVVGTDVENSSVF